MSDLISIIKQLETDVEEALKSYEMESQLEPALKVYQEVESKILALEGITSEHEAYSEQQRVLAAYQCARARLAPNTSLILYRILLQPEAPWSEYRQSGPECG